MSPQGSPPLQLTEPLWMGGILALSLAVILFTIWCLANGITTIFMHLYYFPIVLLVYHYRKKGLVLATLLALAYVALVAFFDPGQPDVIVGAVYRSLVFVGIAAVIAFLSERLVLEKRSARESAEIRERYISLAPAVILALDRDGVITYLNRKGGEILECVPDDVMGKSWFDQFLQEKDRDQVKGVFSDMMAGLVEPHRVFENAVLTCSGRMKIIRWHNSVLHDEGGAVSGTLGFGEDVTEEKEAQDTLRKMQQFQESVIANANVWITVLAPNGTILVWNDAAEAISGYKKSDVLGKNTVWKNLYPDNHYRKKVTEEIQRIIGRDSILENFETEIRCEDWTTKTIVWNTRGLRDDRGIVTSYIAIGRDVTAQKAAEFRAGESSRFLGAMIDTLPMPIFFKDTGGKYLGCNPPFEEFIGIKRENLQGKTVYDISPKDLADKYAAADQQLFDNPVPQRYETQVQYADGSRHDVIFYKAPFFNKDGSLGGLIGTFLDITERKKMEVALRESQERYRNVLENVPDLILVHRNGTILYVNPSVTEVTGYRSDELIDTNVTDFIIPEYYPVVSEAMSRRIDGKDLEPYEIGILTKSEKRLTVTVRGSLIDFDGAPASLNVLTDITERKRAEEALRESEIKVRKKLAAILEPEGDIGLLELSDIIDSDAIQHIMDDFYRLTGIGVAILDNAGKILVATGWQEICTQFHRVNPETCKYCKESDLTLSHGVEPGTFKRYKCKNNLWDIATPIMVGGNQLGNLFLGQFFFDDEKPDREFFRTQAKQYGFDEEKYLSALDRVPRFSHDTVDRVMKFYTTFTDLISTLSYSNVILARTLVERDTLMQSLNTSEEKFRNLADYTYDWEYWIAPDGAFTYMTPSCERITGYPASEFYQNPALFSDIIHPDDRAIYHEHMEISSVSTAPESVDYRIVRRDGRIRWISHICQPIYGRNGELLGRRSSNRDATERKEAEIALRESEEKYRAFFSTSRDCVFITTLDGRWLDFNTTAVELFGYESRDELMQVPISRIYANPEERDAHIRYIREKGYSFEYPVDLRKKDGTIINTLITTSIRKDATGTIIGFQGSIRDITERKRTEKLLLDNQMQLATAMDLAHLANWEFDVMSGIFTFNDRFYAMFGTTAEREGGYQMPAEVYAREFVHPDDAGMVGEEVKKAVETTDPLFMSQAEHRIIRRDGAIRYILVRFAVTKDAEGRTIKTHGANQDITERKVAENALALEKERMESLLSLSLVSKKEDSEIIAEVVEDAIRLTRSTIGYLATMNDDESVMTMQYWSKSAHESCNVIDKPIVYPVEKTGLWGEAVRQRRPVVTNDYAAESPLKRGIPTGHVNLVRHMNIPVFDGDHIVAVAGVGNKDADYDEGDIQQLQLLMQGWWQIAVRKRAEEALWESREHYRALIDYSQLAIAVLDVNHKIIMVNPRFSTLFKKPVEDFVGKYCFNEFEKRETVCTHCPGVRAIASGKPEEAETEGVLDDGSRFYARNRAVPFFGPDGAVKGFVEMVEDVTDRKHAEEEREKVRWWQAGVNRILESVISPVSLDEKLKIITDGVVDIFGADFCRIWLIDRGDQCDAGCMHAGVTEGPHVCRFRDKCLHLRASSGRYTHLDGKAHGRVPFGAYKIGRIASGDDVRFLTNDVEHDPRVHDHEWAKSLGLVAFAGYRLKPHDGDVLGVFALFTRFPISPDMDAILEGLSRAISLAIQKEITDRALRENEIRLNEVSEMAHVGGWELDVATKAVHWTRETYQIHEIPEGAGYDLSNALLFYDMPGRTRLESALQQCMDTGEPVDLELPFTSAKGKHLWTRVMGRAVKTDGRILKLTGTFQDITGRKQAEDALRESRQLFADIISFLPDPTFVIDKDGVVLAWNRALEQLSGIPAAEIIGKGDHEYSIWVYGKRRPVLIDLVLNPDQDSARENYTKILWDERTVTAQAEFMQPGTGKMIPLSLVASPLLDSQGNATGAIESMRDISSIKEAEAALARLNASLETIVQERTRKLEEEVVQRMQAEKDVQAALNYTRSVIEANPDLMVVLDENGVILDVNAAGETLTGLPKEQLIGTPYFGYLVEDGTVQSAFAGLLQEGTIENFVRIRRTDGHVTPLSVHATVVRGWEGGKDRIIVSAHDITRQKQDEEAIRSSRQMLTNVVENFPGVIFWKDQNSMYLGCNKNFSDGAGLNGPEEIVGKTDFDLPWAKTDAESYRSFDREVMEKGISRLNIIETQHQKDGRIVWFDTSKIPLFGPDGTVIGILGASHDITRQKQDEEAIKASLEEKVLLLREVHHRVKNNLQIIISLVNLQMRQTDDPAVKQIMSETQNRVRAMSLVHEKLYRSESLSRIDFADYTRFLATQLFSFYGTDTRRVRLDFAMGKIMVDINTAVPLGLLMNELISNALKHAFPNGREGTISISGSEADNLITLAVHDNGIGIPEELDWKNTTSLGMRLVTSLIDQIDGTLTLDRKDGTSWTITVKMVTSHGGAP